MENNVKGNKIKFFLVSLIIIIAALFTELLICADYNLGNFKKIWVTDNDEIIIMDIESFGNKGYDYNNNTGCLQSLEDDPSLSKEVKSNVGEVSLKFEKPLNHMTSICVYYTNQKDEAFSEDKMRYQEAQVGQEILKIDIGEYVENIRIDIGAGENEVFYIKSVNISTGLGRSKDIADSINFSRVLMIVLIYAVIGLHFLVDLPKLYEFIYKKRYVIALSMLFFLVINKYHGSSITLWNYNIQPNIEIEGTEPIIGKLRQIRSDEWVVNTPYILSQKYTPEPYQYFNTNAGARDTDVFMILGAPIKDIVTFAKPFNIGYLLLGSEYGLSFWWYGRLIALFLVSFELGIILTRRSKFSSFVGACMIGFAPAVHWWFSTSLVDMLIFGQLAIVVVYHYLNTENKFKKILCAVGLSMSACAYIAVFYPPWQITFGYVFLLIMIWVLMKNFRLVKLKKFDWYVIGLCIAFTVFIILRVLILSSNAINLMLNTSYPGKRILNGGGAFSDIFLYVLSPLFQIYDQGNPCEASQFISLFPVPIILTGLIWIKNKKVDFLECGLVIISTIYFLWAVVPWPEILGQITLLANVQPKRIVPVIGMIQIYLIMRIISKQNVITAKGYKLLFTAITVTIATIYLAIKCINIYMPLHIPLIYQVSMTLIVFLGIYGIMRIDTERKKYQVGGALIVISILSSIGINPVVKGVNAIYQKPVAKEIQLYNQGEPNSVWAGMDSFILANYPLLLGCKTITSTNVYPNIEAWEKLDNTGEYKDIYNRYAHIVMSLTQEKTSFSATQQGDVIKIDLSVNDIAVLGLDYIVTWKNDLQNMSNENVQIQNVYTEDGISIYKLVY